MMNVEDREIKRAEVKQKVAALLPAGLSEMVSVEAHVYRNGLTKVVVRATIAMTTKTGEGQPLPA